MTCYTWFHTYIHTYIYKDNLIAPKINSHYVLRFHHTSVCRQVLSPRLNGRKSSPEPAAQVVDCSKLEDQQLKNFCHRIAWTFGGGGDTSPDVIPCLQNKMHRIKQAYIRVFRVVTFSTYGPTLPGSSASIFITISTIVVVSGVDPIWGLGARWERESIINYPL